VHGRQNKTHGNKSWETHYEFSNSAFKASIRICANETEWRSVCCMLQCVAVCCSVLQCVEVCCSVLQCVVVCCSVLQCVAVCCIVSQCVTVCCVLQSAAVWHSVLQCVAVCCSVLQCVAVRRRVLQTKQEREKCDIHLGIPTICFQQTLFFRK